MAEGFRHWYIGQRKFAIGWWCETENRNRDNVLFVLKIDVFLFKFHFFVIPIELP